MPTTLPSAAITGRHYIWNGHILIKTILPLKFVVIGTTRAFRQPGQFVNIGDSNPVGPLVPIRVV